MRRLGEDGVEKVRECPLIKAASVGATRESIDLGRKELECPLIKAASVGATKKPACERRCHKGVH